MKRNLAFLGIISTCLVLSSAGAVFAEAVTEGSSLQSRQVASSEDMTAVDEIVEDWMVPIPVSDLNDGTYDIDTACSSSMFVIDECKLTVEGGKAEAALTMGGTGYLYVYPGTGEEAAAADDNDLITYTEAEDGRHVFTIPVENLDEPVSCAAYSRKKEQWYPRTLVFVSTSLPEDAFKSLPMTSLEELDLEDGSYLVDAVLSGGSGKTTIDSPAALTVENGEALLTVVFSSPHYDYMIVGGEKYEPVNEEGNSTFLIPVAGLDYQMPVTADTTAMSKPHEIDYTIFLDSKSLTKE